MRPIHSIHDRMLPAVLAVLLLAGRCPALDSDGEAPVRIVLRGSATGTPGGIRLADFVQLIGGTSRLRDGMAALDFEGPSRKTGEVLISRQQIEIRLRLAGYRRDQFQVLGAEAASVRLVDTTPTVLDDATVVAAIREAMAASRGVSERDLEIRLTDPLRTTAVAAAQRYESVEVKPYLSTTASLGTQRIKVGLYESGRLFHTMDVAIQVLLLQELTVTARALSAGEPIAPGDIKLVRRGVTEQDMVRAAGNVVGRKLRRGVPSGAVIQSSDLSPKKIEDENPPLIRRGDVVTLVARSGRIRVSSSAGEAMQTGHLGERIHVRNVNSKRVVAGVVASGTEVEVTY